MPGRNNLSKHWNGVSFETQVRENIKEDSEIKAELTGSDELVIPTKEKPKPKKPKKKTRTKKNQTATDIHLEVKKILEDSPDRDGHLKALSVLEKAVHDGFRGKRLRKWRLVVDTYLVANEVEMGNTVKSMREKDGLVKYVEERNEKEPGFKELVEQEKENIKKGFTELCKESTISEIDKERKEMIDIPDLPLDELEEAMCTEPEDYSIQDEAGGSVVFGIIGAGQAGGRITESFYNLGYKKSVIVNTAEHDLSTVTDIPENQKILMDSGTSGGAGKDMTLGKQAAEKHQQEIYEKLQKVFGEVDRILVCAGAGGGTGGGGCMSLVDTAKKYLTYLGVEKPASKITVLLTLPTAGEVASPQVADNAHDVATKLSAMAKRGQVGSLLIFDNDKIKKMYPKLTVKRFWPTVNATVTGLFHMFNVLSSKPGNPTSFDPADYQRVLSAGGCMIVGFTTLKQYTDGTDVSKAIRENLEKGLLCGGFDISTAEAAACVATASDNILGNTPGLMSSLETGFDTLANITGNAVVFRGIYEVAKDKLVVYTMVTGLDAPQKRLKDLKRFQNK